MEGKFDFKKIEGLGLVEVGRDATSIFYVQQGTGDFYRLTSNPGLKQIGDLPADGMKRCAREMQEFMEIHGYNK